MSGTAKAFVVLLLISSIATVIYESNRAKPLDTSSAVNELVFLRVVRNGGEDYAREALGNPARSGDGEIAKYECEVAGAVRTQFTIRESSDKPKPDYFLLFKGGSESIRLLYSGDDQRLVAGEYLLSDIPIYYFGPHNTDYRPISAVSGQVSRSGDSLSPVFDRRKRVIIDFFKEQVADQQQKASPTASKLSSEARSAPKSTDVVPTLPLAEEPKPSVPDAVASNTVAGNTEEHSTDVQPNPEEQEYRTWTDSAGKTTVRAKFVRLDGDKVTLIKRGEVFLRGPTINLSLANLSAQDQQWIKEKLAPPPPAKPDTVVTEVATADIEQPILVGPMPKEAKEPPKGASAEVLEEKKKQHTSWTVRVATQKPVILDDKGIWMTLAGGGTTHNYYQSTMKTYSTVTIQGELISYIGNDVHLKNAFGDGYFKFNNLGASDQMFLTEYRKLERGK